MSIAADKLAQRDSFRMALFMRRRWSEQRASVFVDRLRERDAERDERRACIECKHLQRSGNCFMALRGQVAGAIRDYTPIQDQLQRCAPFEFQTPA